MASILEKELKDSKPDWKRIWQLSSGICYAPSEEDVKTTLLDITKELQDGILQFKKYDTSVHNNNLEKLLKTKKQEKLLPFTSKLQQLLDLDSEQCWDLLCYYLTNEYRGTANSLTTLISTESNMIKLLDDIWGFYTLERMIVLKIVKNMLEYYKNPSHPYHHEYVFILDNITLTKLKKSYLKQLHELINELPPNKLTAGEFINYQIKLMNWNERNCREITEILHILVLLVNECGIDLDEMKILVECFKQHSFGRQQRYLNESNETHAQLIIRITYSEIILFMRCLDVYESNIDKKLMGEIIKSLTKQIITMHHAPEHGPLLLTWMLINFYMIDGPADDEESKKFRQFGGKAMQLNVFEYLNEVVTHAMFNDISKVAHIARKTVYNHLLTLCIYFDYNGSVGRNPGVYKLFSELLTTPIIAAEFCNQDDNGVRSLYNTALENFPIDFINLANICYSLTKSGKSVFVKEQVEKLPIFTELYDERKFQLESISMDEFILVEKYKPFNGIDFEIPTGTSSIIVQSSQEYYVHFRCQVNFFDVLHNEINLLLTQVIHYTKLNKNSIERVSAGIKYLALAITKIKAPNEITGEMVHPTELCIDLLNKFKVIQSPPIELLSNCLNVCTALLPHFKMEISGRILNLNILPYVNNYTLDYKKYANGVNFDSSLVGSYLINLERKQEKYDFLMAYLNFLRKYSILNAADGKNESNSLFKIEIPGLLFLLREVFPHIHNWRFSSEFERNRIYREALEYICEILDVVSNGDTSEKQVLKEICVYSLLNLENGMVLLKFIGIGNPYLQSSMEIESNWVTAPSKGIIRLVRLSMRILMHLLRLKSIIFENTVLSPLEALIFTQPKQRDTLRIIPILTCYMNNIFDRSLPILSCRLLRRIALEYKMSLLACLDMESDQIRQIFLQRLPDELESDDLKKAILELVEACIEKQPGLTEAFFKIHYEKRIFATKDHSSQIADSIVTYFEMYLTTVFDVPECIEDPLPLCIMSLFHALWKNNMQILIDNLIHKNATFWSALCAPLFADKFIGNCKAYSQILNILGIQIYSLDKETKINENLRATLQKFFDTKYFNKWLDHVFKFPISTTSTKTEETPEWLSRLQSFKDFMIIMLNKKFMDFEIPEEQLKTLAHRNLNILVQQSELTDDLRPFVVLSELYLIVLFSFKHNYTLNTKQDAEMVKQITKLLSNLSICYEDLHIRAKESCLSICIKATQLLATELKKDTNVAIRYLDSIIIIICNELNCLELTVKIKLHSKNVEVDSSNNKTLELSLNLLKTIANIFSNEADGSNSWDTPFSTNKVFNRLLSCAHLILQIPKMQKLSIEILDVLIVFAKSNCSENLLYCDIAEYLWLKLLPPKELLQPPAVIPQNTANGNNKDLTLPWTAQKWWPIYSRGIELITKLLQNHSYQFLPDALKFVGIHEQYLMDSLLIARQSLEPNAIVLIKSTMYFVQELVEFEKEWRLEHSQSLFNLMRCVQILLGHSISLFNKQRILKGFIIGVGPTTGLTKEATGSCPPEDIVTALNDITEIMIISSKCLLKFSPRLLDLLCSTEFSSSKWEPLFEIQFGPPKLNDNNQLTFGTVLSIIGVLTKTLHLQGLGFHEIPLNNLPDLENVNETTSATSILPTNPPSLNTTTRTNFSKSISINSSMSSTAPSNEILSNLDGELCQNALENILTLVASQSLLALKNFNLNHREKQLIRREISTELISFHEFIRKKVLLEFREHRDIWHRKKRGILYMSTSENNLNGKKSISAPSTSSQRKSDRRSDHSMRDHVLRKLHLQQQKSNEFEMSQMISPINKKLRSSKSLTQVPASTPNIGPKTSADNIFSMDDNYDEELIQYFEPEEPKYSPLSYIQFVEEDYLQFLSNIFTIICQSD